MGVVRHVLDGAGQRSSMNKQVAVYFNRGDSVGNKHDSGAQNDRKALVPIGGLLCKLRIMFQRKDDCFKFEHVQFVTSQELSPSLTSRSQDLCSFHFQP